PGRQLGVVQHFVVPARFRVFVGQSVEAVPPVGADLPAPRGVQGVTLDCASIWNRYSLPMRRAGSPVHVSAACTANRTPASCSSSATARVVRCPRLSSAPAQPTQNRYSTSAGSSPSTTGTSNGRFSIQPRRSRVPRPHGSPACSRSRRLITSSLGDNGLPVFQAGHCDWQRPHSVHVAKSSSPFQVKSSIAPRPTRSSSPGSSKSTGLPAEYTGSSAPSARGRRENATLNGAV